MIKQIQLFYKSAVNFVGDITWKDIGGMMIAWIVSIAIFIAMGVMAQFFPEKILVGLEYFTGWLFVFSVIPLSVFAFFYWTSELKQIKERLCGKKSNKNTLINLNGDKKLVQFVKWSTCTVASLNVLMYVLYLWLNYGASHPHVSAIGFSLMMLLDLEYGLMCYFTSKNIKKTNDNDDTRINRFT